jgi:hypothetical protein
MSEIIVARIESDDLQAVAAALKDLKVVEIYQESSRTVQKPVENPSYGSDTANATAAAVRQNLSA